MDYIPERHDPRFCLCDRLSIKDLPVAHVDLIRTDVAGTDADVSVAGPFLAVHREVDHRSGNLTHGRPGTESRNMIFFPTYLLSVALFVPIPSHMGCES